MSLDNVWLSYVDYLPNPARPEEGRIALGCVLQALAGARSLVSLCAREELTGPELEVMDGIGREMLAQPVEFLDQEILRLLNEPRGKLPSFKEGGLLRALSRVHRWSLQVSPPQLIRIERALSQSNFQALNAASDQLFIAHQLGKDVPLTRRLQAKRIIPEDWRAQVPPAWQIAHRSLAAPARQSV